MRKYTDGIATGVATLPLNQRHPPTTWFHVKPIGRAWYPMTGGITQHVTEMPRWVARGFT
ncbi:MAG: hypothetical protein EBT47_04375 [Chloroflexi bacterium]|nr:hypothetical protein [Chloroflexota bacterium]